MKVSLFKTIMEITLAVSLLMIARKIPFFESIFSQVSLVVGLFTLILGAKTICDSIKTITTFANQQNWKTIFPKAVIALGIAVFSLFFLWRKLFTSGTLWWFTETDWGNVILWAINTGVYSYLLLLGATSNLEMNK